MSEKDKLICFHGSEISNSKKISFGPGCVIHPLAKIIVEGDCQIIFGEYNIIEENVVIKAVPKYSAFLNAEETITMYIGNYNFFKIGSYIENSSIENYCIFDYRCHVVDSYIESNSIITPTLSLKGRKIKKGKIALDNHLECQNNMYTEKDREKFNHELYKILSIANNPKK